MTEEKMLDFSKPVKPVDPQYQIEIYSHGNGGLFPTHGRYRADYFVAGEWIAIEWRVDGTAGIGVPRGLHLVQAPREIEVDLYIHVYADGFIAVDTHGIGGVRCNPSGRVAEFARLHIKQTLLGGAGL